MKKFLMMILSVCTLTVGTIAFSSCNFIKQFFEKECVHTWQTEGSNSTACMEYGEGTHTCTECGETRVAKMPAKGHTMKDGYCIDCGAKESEGLETRVILDEPFYGKPLYAMISGIGTCTDKNVVIPAAIDGVPVKGIDDNAFLDNENILSVYADVETVGGAAFKGCSNLQTVAFSDKLTQISQYSLASTAIWQDEAFWLDGTMYFGDILMASKASGEYEAKEGTRLIASNAFGLGDGHTLKKVVLPESVEYIGASAFSYNIELSEVSVGSNVKYIGENAFEQTAFESNEKNWENDALYLGDYLLKFKEKEQTELVVRDGTLLIADSACICHDTLVHLSLPASLQYINEDAFLNNYKLVEVYNRSEIELMAGEEEPSGLALYALHFYKIPKERRVHTEGDYILYTDGEETSLLGYLGTDKEIIVPDGVTKIHRDACSRLFEITSVTFPESLKVIGENAFMLCNSLTEVRFAEGLKEIENYAFEGCNLKTLILPSGVEKVGYSAFSRNEGLTTAALPYSVYFLAEGVFANCPALNNVTFGDRTHWFISWSVDMEWRAFEGYANINECADLLERLTDEHAKYAFVKWEYKEEFYPTPPEEENKYVEQTE